MRRHRRAIARFSVAASCMVGAALVSGQRLPNEPFRQFGASITGAFEGWYDNPDGSHNFLVGYLNRNQSQALDIPVGPNNQIEPGGPDYGQPTHFLPGRQYGVFLVTVPKEFTPQQRLTWTIVANGQTTSIPLRLHPDYEVSPFKDVAINNTPPTLRFDEQGSAIQGPVARMSKARTASATTGVPLPLALWSDDDALYASGTMAVPRNLPQPVELWWSKYRGPGSVTFDKAHPKMDVLAGGKVNEPFRGKSVSTATFSEPGEYVLHVTATDYSGEGGGGEVCCWTTAMVQVVVKE